MTWWLSLATEPKPGWEEVEEVIFMPSFDANKTQLPIPASKIEIDDDVERELREYVRSIAARYKDNPFHNFGMFNFVAQSAMKYPSFNHLEMLTQQPLHFL